MMHLDMVLDPFKDKKTVARAQRIAQIADSDPLIEETLRLYTTDGISMARYPLPHLVPALSPKQIQVAFQKCMQDKLAIPSLGRFASQLIQTSYNAGNNGFTLNTGDFLFDFIGRLEGTHERKLNLRVEGNVGDYFGYKSSHLDAKVLGSTEYNLGSGSQYCSFFVEKDIGIRCATGSNRTSYTVQGNMGIHVAGSAMNCEFNLHGSIPKRGLKDPHNMEPLECVFRTDDKKMYKQLRSWLYSWNGQEKLNRVELIR